MISKRSPPARRSASILASSATSASSTRAPRRSSRATASAGALGRPTGTALRFCRPITLAISLRPTSSRIEPSATLMLPSPSRASTSPRAPLRSCTSSPTATALVSVSPACTSSRSRSSSRASADRTASAAEATVGVRLPSARVARSCSTCVSSCAAAAAACALAVRRASCSSS